MGSIPIEPTDVQGVQDRFVQAWELQKAIQEPEMPMRFTEIELKGIIYLLGELKYRIEKEKEGEYRWTQEN